MMRISSHNPIPTAAHHRQRGAVLVISLLILLMMTIIGVTAMQSSTLEERMALNSQQTDMVFQGAESAIQKVVNAATPTASSYVQASDPVLQAMSAGQNNTVALSSTQTALPGGNANLDTSANITYTKQTAPPSGFQIDMFTAYSFAIEGKATVTSSNATQTHVQGLQRVGPKR